MLLAMAIVTTTTITKFLKLKEILSFEKKIIGNEY